MILLILLYGFLAVILPVLAIYTKSRVILWLKKSKAIEMKTLRENQRRENSHLSKVMLCTDIEMYHKCRESFGVLMKNGMLNKKEVIYLKNLINSCLGSNVLSHYDKFKFKNDAHEIYVKLKNSYLEKGDFEKIFEYLEECKSWSEKNINQTKEGEI